MDLAFCTGELSCWNRKGPSPNCCHKVGSTESSRMRLDFPSLELRGLTRTMKTSPDHYSSSTKLYSWHYALGQVVFSCYLSFTPLQPTLGIDHGDLRLVCDCSVMENSSWSSQRTVILLTLLLEVVWNSAVSVATEDRRFLRSTNSQLSSCCS